MQVVVNMPDEMWARVKAGYVPLGISKYLREGIPLEGHSDLIDREVTLNLYRPKNVSDEAWAQTTLGRSVLESPAVVEAQSQILAGPERTPQEPSEHRGR